MPAGFSAPTPAIGDRVVVRYRLGGDAPADWRQTPNPPAAAGPTQSDITGILRERTDDALVIERDDQRHRLALSAISSIRLLSRRVVRNSEIREVERALMLAAAAGERAELDGWLVNAAAPPGATGPADLRSGAAAPIDFGSTAAGLPAALAWLADRALPARVVVADRLLRASALGASIGTAEAFEVLVGPDPASTIRAGEMPSTPAGDCSPIAEGVAAATVAAVDDAARTAWRSAGFELHHTCHLLTL